MNRLRHLLFPSILTCVLMTALAFAATASAETTTGEATSTENLSIPGEADIIRASASYDSTAGTVTVTATTREEPGTNPELTLLGGFTNVSQCSFATRGSGEGYPQVSLYSPYSTEVGSAAGWTYFGSKEEIPGEESTGVGEKSVNGKTTTLTATPKKAVDQPFNCVLVGVVKGAEPIDYVFMPLVASSTLLPSNTIPAETKPTTPPPPGLLSFATSKPVKAKAGNWTKVKVKVANAGGTAIGPIAFKAKSPDGVIVKPRSPKLPALLPGQTWTVNLQVKLTEKAKPKSTIRLTGTSGALTATCSVVVKAAG